VRHVLVQLLVSNRRGFEPFQLSRYRRGLARLGRILLVRRLITVDKAGRPPLPGDSAANRLPDTLSVLTLTTGRLVRAVRNVHFHYGQVTVILAVIPAARLVRHQHLGALVRVGHRLHRLLGATFPRRLEPDVFGNVPAPVRTVSAARTLERLAVQVADDVHVEPRSSGRPERAVWALEHLHSIIYKVLYFYSVFSAQV